jgi:hypothetical protein
MKKYNSIELLNGFFMGSFTGTLIEWALLGVYNWMSHWRGASVLVADWWMLLPFPLISGILMARAIASLHLEDY